MSGGAYQQARGDISGEVESPYGEATITYDDYHVPSVQADTEQAAYYAVGYGHAADRLFQLDSTRRLAQGTLAAVLGPFAVGLDVFHKKLDFCQAAEVTRTALAETEHEPVLQAYADGISAYIETEPLCVEFGLLDYQPEPWTVTDSLLVSKLMAWLFAGGFGDEREIFYRQRFGEETYREVFPERLDGRPPAIREGKSEDAHGVSIDPEESSARLNPSFVEWLSQFDVSKHVGSNAWVVSGDYTSTGKPIVCSDPHVQLQAPPFWYEQRIRTPDTQVYGATVPGIPFVVIGENERGAWGVTALGGNVTNLYTYDISEDGSQYRYQGEWRTFETERQTVEVRAGEDRQVEVKKTIHGPFLDREIDGTTYHVGVAWPGFSDADLLLSGGYSINKSSGLSEFRAACEQLGIALNIVYADRDGNTLYQVTGKIPIRHVNGEVVRGDRLFDGSAGDGEWAGFTAYGHSTWESFVPFDELPAAVNADYVVTANQRPTDDPPYPIGGRGFSPGLRATRIYERLDRAAERGKPMDDAFMRSIQLDTHDIAARRLVPAILDAGDGMPDKADPWLDALEEWNYRMERDSRAALLFDRFLTQFQAATWGDTFEQKGLGEEHWPDPWALVTLAADSEFFDRDRSTVIVEAMNLAIDEIDEAGWAVYGDVSESAMRRPPLGILISGLNYPRRSIDGSPRTVRMNAGGSWGAGYRMIANLDDDSLLTVLAGGNDGSPFSEHYLDQLPLWANGEYRRIDDAPAGDPDITFEEGAR